MSHIEKKRNVWYATMKVPKELQDKVGRTKFIKSLRTTDKSKAVDLARPYIVAWKRLLAQAGGETNALQREALRWKDDYQATYSPDGYESEHAADLHHIVSSGLGERAQELEEQHGPKVAHEFFEIATGKATLLRDHIANWEASISHLAEKTQDQMKKDVATLSAQFKTVQSVNAESVAEWVERLTQGATPITPATLKRMAHAWRSLWAHLVNAKVIPKGSNPFADLKFPGPTQPTTKARKGWTPFAPIDIPKLIAAAEQRKDTALVNLIKVAAYSGARIEELCSLKVSEVTAEALHITDAKTRAGIREVPIHPTIAALVKSMAESSKDDYLFEGLTFNKYNDRSNGIGKRFGRLKDSLGFGPSHVFHSIRKTFVTLLEDSGVHENLAADIVGHEKPRITFGLYSGGASLKTKAEAVSKVLYPELPAKP